MSYKPWIDNFFTLMIYSKALVKIIYICSTTQLKVKYYPK